MDDADLMVLVQADDAGAFGLLYDRMSARAYGVAYGVARDHSRAEEIVQDAFLSVWRSRARYEAAQGTVSAWVMGTVRHRATDAVRRHARHDRRRAGGDDAGETITAPGDVEEVVGERDQAERLRSTLAQLPAAQRDVIALAYFGELSASEIAQELSLPLGTVKGRMRLGLDKLRGES